AKRQQGPRTGVIPAAGPFMASGCRKPVYAAPIFTDSGHRRFSTQISTQNRAHRRLEVPYLLITAANWIGRPESVTSLPSWSCGFDSRRPLRRPLCCFRSISAAETRLGSTRSAVVRCRRPAGGLSVGLSRPRLGVRRSYGLGGGRLRRGEQLDDH